MKKCSFCFGCVKWEGGGNSGLRGGNEGERKYRVPEAQKPTNLRLFNVESQKF